MEKKILYRIIRADGGIDVTPNKPTEGTYSETYRLIADEGKALTDGTDYYMCIDTDFPDKFMEVDVPNTEILRVG